jgi:hypothetical protein
MRNPLCTIAFPLLFIGFAWLIWCAASIRPFARSIAVREVRNFDEHGSYSGKEAQNAIRRTAFDLVDRIPWIAPPAGLMLVGGILLYGAGRREP